MSRSGLSPRAGSRSVSAPVVLWRAWELLLARVRRGCGVTGAEQLWEERESQPNPTQPQLLPPWESPAQPRPRCSPGAASRPVPVARAAHGAALPSPGSLRAQFSSRFIFQVDWKGKKNIYILIVKSQPAFPTSIFKALLHVCFSCKSFLARLAFFPNQPGIISYDHL